MKNVDLVQGQLDAYNNFDVETFCTFYHQDIQVYSLLDNKLLTSGMNDFRASYEKLFKHFPDQECILKSRLIKDNSIVDEELIIGRPTHPDGLKAIAIYGFQDALIDRVWFI